MKSVIQTIFKTFLLSLLVAGQVNFVYAQTASILPPAKTTFFDQNGKPLTSGKVQFYIPGTTTAKTTWQDSGETIPNTNPVVLDSAGRAIILGDGSYRQQVFDRNNNLIWDQQTSSTGTGGGGTTATVGDGDLVGTVKPWSGFTAPSQYVFSYGQELARASFPLLFSTLTSQQNVACTSGSPTLTSVGDTSQLPVGAPVESICLNVGATIVSTTISTVTVSSNAIISTNSSARFFPFGNGDGSLTFNTPDLRGRILAGRDNMGGVAASRLTSSTTGFGAIAALGATGGNQSTSTTLVTGNLPPYTPSGTVTGTIPIQGTPGGTNVITSAALGFNNGSVTNLPGSFTFAGTSAAGQISTPIVTSRIQPTEILNWIIKTLPDTNANSFFGVASIGGMFGVLTCGTGITCSGNQISAVSSVVPPPSSSTLGGVFTKTCATSNWFNILDNTGTFGCSQPNFTDLVGSIAVGQIPTNIISNTMIRQSGALSLVGRSANSTGNVADISATAASGCVFEETGSTLACSTVVTAGIASAAVTGAKIATNTVANSNLAQGGAATLKGNPTASLANDIDFTIQSLTARGAPDATNDKIPLYDNAAGTIKYVTPGQVASSATAGVSSIAGNTGAFTLGGLLNNSVNVLQVTAAAKTDEQAGTSAILATTPSQQQQHDSAAKAEVNFTGSSASINSSYNVSGVVRNSAGNYTVTFTTAFAAATYACHVTTYNTAVGTLTFGQLFAIATGTIGIGVFNTSFTNADPVQATLVCFGRQ
jgi:hypothetical protein